MWDMPTVREWIRRGASPADRDAPTIADLQRMEGVGLVELHDVSTTRRVGILVTLTGAGEYEADRLAAGRPAAPPS